MAGELPGEQISYELALKLRDLEESQKLMKERMLLIGQNLIESQEKNLLEITDIKKRLLSLESDVKRSSDRILSLTGEMSKSARKEELAILERQFKMFEPLKFARIQDIEKIIDKKLHTHNSKKEESKDSFWSART